MRQIGRSKFCDYLQHACSHAFCCQLDAWLVTKTINFNHLSLSSEVNNIPTHTLLQQCYQGSADVVKRHLVANYIADSVTAAI